MNDAPFFVIETGAYDDGNPQRLLEAIRARGLRCRAVEFSDGTDARLAPADAPVIAYGSLGMVRGMLGTRRWHPVAWLDEAALACHGYYAALGDLVLQKRHTFVRWADLPQRFTELVSSLGKDGAIFVRPDDCWKTFAGRIVNAADFARWHQQNTSCYDIPPDTACVAATPQKVLCEWRCVLSAQTVVASSAYNGEGRQAADAAVPAEVIALAETAAARGAFGSLPLFTLDIGQTEEGLFVLEPGCLNASSLYHCDLQRVLEAMLTAARAR
jgi:hypothetical protein